MFSQDVTVNPLGEVSDTWGNCHISSVNLSQLRRKLKRKLTNKDVDQEFDRQLEVFADSDKNIIKYVKHIWALQKLSDERFLIMGKKGKIKVYTEFKAPNSDRGFWLRLYEAAAFLEMDLVTNLVVPEKNGKHTLIYREVELSKLYNNGTYLQMKYKIEEMRRLLEEVWRLCGVANSLT